MGVTSEQSSKWMEEMYWKHFRIIHFLQYLSVGFCRQLAIPKKFAAKLKRILPETVVLQGPGGSQWNVGMSVNNDTFFFKDGWPEFVKDHSLQENDLLLFRYNVDSHFDVVIFDSQGKCEKEPAYFVKKSDDRGLESGVRERNKHSTEWEEDIYWTHFRHIQFVQSLSYNFTQQLALPRKFSEKMKKQLPETIVIKGPSNATWSIGLSSNDKALLLTDGLQDFMKDHSLEENDLLIFQFNWESRFDVLVFDPQSLCEKEYTYFVQKCGDIRDGCRYPEKRKVREASPQDSHMSSQDVECTSSSKTSNDECFTMPSKRNIVGEAKKIRTRGKAGCDDPCHSKPSSKIKEPCTLHDNLKASPDAVRTAAHRNGVLQAALAASTSDSFTVVMRPSAVSSRFRMVVPAKWVHVHLSREDRELVLQMKEKTWRIRPYHSRASVWFAGGGWKDFARENNLDEFDVCVFKPSRRKIDDTLVLNVIIFHAASM